MLKLIFSILDASPWLYWALAWPAIALLLAWALAPALPSFAARKSTIWLGVPVIGLVLFAWRWPWLLAASEFNPDESQIIAGAMALARDPVFWRSVDGTTSGPLNYYPLVPIAWLGLPVDFFTGRLAGLVMITGGCFFIQRALARETTELLARIGVLPVIVFFASVIDPDFVHYSSEHVMLLLAPISLWLITRYRAAALGGIWNLRAAAAAAGAIPWAKLQGVPIALLLLSWIAWHAWESRTKLRAQVASVLDMAFAALIPSLFFAAIAACGGELGAMWQRYVLQNVTYVDEATDLPSSLPGLFRRAMEFGQFIALGATALVGAIAVTVNSIRYRRIPCVPFCIALAWVAVAIFAIALPRREFLHYLLLAVVPLGLAAGFALAELARARPTSRGLVLSFLALGVGAPLIWRAPLGPPFIIGALQDQWRHPSHADGALLATLRRPGDTLAIWGWSARTYIEAKMPQATRDTHTFWAIEEHTGHDLHRQVFLADFRAHRPEFFVDATGEGAFFFGNRVAQGHENFPDLATEVRRYYTPIIDVGFSRVYVRNDRFVEQPITPSEAAGVAARARQINLSPELPAATLVDGAHLEMIGNRNALVLPAPARAYFILDQTTRAIDLSVRFHPRALAEGLSDGADIVLQLVDNRGEREVFRHHVGFAQRPLELRVALPPFGAGTHLQIRAQPGPSNNNAWDWLCVENLRQVRRSLYTAEQFPHFDRLPTTAEFDTAALAGPESPAALRATVPGRFEIPLTPSDRRFTLALRSTHAGDTEFVVERVGDSGSDALLARGGLANLPRRDGAALVDLALPASASGDRLRITLRSLAVASAIEFERVIIR